MNVPTKFARGLFLHLLGREPFAAELDEWRELSSRGLTEHELFEKLIATDEYRRKAGVIPGHPPGHFYSPIVDPETVSEYWTHSKNLRWFEIPGVDLSLADMEDFWQEILPILKSASFSDGPGGPTRYHLRGRFPRVDATVLWAMVKFCRPRRIVEVGSGFSSAAILDAIESSCLENSKLTCIEPHPEVLWSLLRPNDQARVTVLDQQVQAIPVSTFLNLRMNDILFIDSSHVLKTGSDLHYLLFSVLPLLREGVLVHFHDIQYPFEYPREWVFSRKWSWNEIYALRLFLMYNNMFRVRLWPDMLSKELPELFRAAFPTPGVATGSIWLQSVFRAKP